MVSARQAPDPGQFYEITRCDECGGQITVTRQFLTCNQCGLVVASSIVVPDSPTFDFSSDKTSAPFGYIHRSYSVETRLGAGGTGFQPKTAKEWRLLDYNRSILTDRQRAVATRFRLLDNAKSMARMYGINQIVLNRAEIACRGFIYKQTKPVNAVHAFVSFIRVESINGGIPLNFVGLCEFLQLRGFRTTPKLVLRFSLKHNIKPVKRHQTPLHSIPRVMDVIRKVAQHDQAIIERLRRHLPRVDVETWLGWLNAETIHLIDAVLKKKNGCINGPPDLVAAGAIYAADLIIGQNNGKNGHVLTQKGLSEMLGVPEYQVRDAYLIHLKSFVIKL
jgi:transcription initiation factor TFIIIB Brf1 subunit/transcription initiation factor TFIIB